MKVNNNFINKIFYNRYKRSYFNKIEYYCYIEKIYEIYEIVNKKKNKLLEKNKNIEDEILINLKDMYFKKKLIKEKKIIKLYRIFEVNLVIKNTQLGVNRNDETNVLSYLYLGILINDIKKLNKLQKLNVYLKIFDLLYVKNKKTLYKNSNLSKIFLKNIINIININKIKNNK